MHSSPPTFPGAAATPWYAQRWPWLLMLGPALVLVAMAITTWLALDRPDALVVGDYYKKGKAINQDLRRDRVASALRLAVEMRYDPAAQRLEGKFESFGRPMSTPFRVLLAHPTQPGKDLALDARPDVAGRFAVALASLERTHWQVVLEGGQRDWRLAGSWNWSKTGKLALQADPL